MPKVKNALIPCEGKQAFRLRLAYPMRRFLFLAIGSCFFLPTAAYAEGFYLYFGTYESKSRINKIEATPTLHSSVFSSMTRCESAGEKIFNEIYKPIKYFDGRWICVEK